MSRRGDRVAGYGVLFDWAWPGQQQLHSSFVHVKVHEPETAATGAAHSIPCLDPCRIGGAKVLMAGVALWSFGTLIAPPAAHLGIWALCATRVLVSPPAAVCHPCHPLRFCMQSQQCGLGCNLTGSSPTLTVDRLCASVRITVALQPQQLHVT